MNGSAVVRPAVRWFRAQQLRCVVPILMLGASDALVDMLLSCSSRYLRMSVSRWDDRVSSRQPTTST